MLRPTAVLILGLIGSLQDAPAPDAAHKAKLAETLKALANRHASIGDFLGGRHLHARAREEYLLAVAADPDHEKARKKLGYRKAAAGGWENDPEFRWPASEPKKAEDAVKACTEAEKKQVDAGKSTARDWLEVAAAAEAAGLTEEAAAALRRAVEADPANGDARKKLGHEKPKEGGWAPPEDRSFRSELAAGVAKAEGGAEDKGESEITKRMQLAVQRRSSPRFLLESTYLTQEQLADLVRHGEHAYAMFQRATGIEKLFPRPYHVMLLKDKGEHEKFVDAFWAPDNTNEVQKAFTKKSSGTGRYPFGEFHVGGSPQPEAMTRDYFAHYTAQSLVNEAVGRQVHWLEEGMALWFSSQMKGTASWACVQLAGTGTGGGEGKNYRDPRNWPVTLRTWIKEGRDPSLDPVLKATSWAELDAEETLKAWSLVDFLLTEQRDRLGPFLADLKGAKDGGESSFKAVFGWTLPELDAKWKAWVRVRYQ